MMVPMSERSSLIDQAHGLRLHRPVSAPAVIPVLANGRDPDQAAVLAHLAVAMQRQGYKVLLLDADRALLASALGVAIRYDLGHWMNRECRLDQVIRPSAEGPLVVSAAAALERAMQASDPQRLLAECLGVLGDIDVCFVVAPAEGLRQLLGPMLSRVWMISATDTTAMTVTYARIKAATQQGLQGCFHLIYNRASDVAQCEQAHAGLQQTVQRFTRARLVFGGAVPLDPLMQANTAQRRTAFSQAPDGPLCGTFEQIVFALMKQPLGTWGWAVRARPNIATGLRLAAREMAV